MSFGNRLGLFKKLQKLAWLSAVVVLWAGDAIGQSAWTRNRNSGFARFSVSTLSTSSFYTPLGNKLRSAKYSDVTASFYGEYGLTNDLTAMLYFPFVRHHSLDTTSSLTAPGDAIAGFKYRFLRGSTPLAVAVDFGLPTGNQRGLVTINGVPQGTFRLPTGDGEFNTRVSLYVSRTFRDGRAFLSGGGGYNFRTRGYTDEVSYSVNGGHRLLQSLWITGTVMGLNPAREPNIEQAVGFGVGEGVEYLTLGGEVRYHLTKKASLSFGYYDPIRGKNLLAGGGFVFALNREF